MSKKYPAKPKKIILWDGSAECVSEDYDDHGGGAFNVRVDADALYDAKNVRKLIKWLEKAEKWLAHKEQYIPRGPKPKKTEAPYERGWAPGDTDSEC